MNSHANALSPNRFCLPSSPDQMRLSKSKRRYNLQIQKIHITYETIWGHRKGYVDKLAVCEQSYNNVATGYRMNIDYLSTLEIHLPTWSLDPQRCNRSGLIGVHQCLVILKGSKQRTVMSNWLYTAGGLPGPKRLLSLTLAHVTRTKYKIFICCQAVCSGTHRKL